MVGKLAIYVALAVAATVPGVVLRLTGAAVSPPLAVLAFGVAIVGAGFLLSWGAEAELHLPQGLKIAVLALITVLPEYSVDVYLAFQAGANPGSQYVQLAAANMTGANRLLIGLMWPLLVLLFWWRSGQPAVTLRRANATEVAFLALASLYSFVIALKTQIDLLDLVVLIGLFAAYVWRASRQPEDEEEVPVGPAAVVAQLPRFWEHTVIVTFTVIAALVILAVAEPFTESIIAAGKTWGFNEFLLIQWLAPLASESPVIVVSVLFALRRKPTPALASLLSDKINQWTLLVGMLPLVYSIGAGRAAVLPLDARQGEEFFLTAAQSVFGVALLLRMRLTRAGALGLLGLFAVQVALAFAFRDNEPLTIRVLISLAWVYLALTAILVLWNRAYLLDFLRASLLNRQSAANRGQEAPDRSPMTERNVHKSS